MKKTLKTIYIRSANVHTIDRVEAKRVLEGTFMPFGSLAPVAPAVAQAMLDVVDGDRAALGKLAEVLSSVESVDQWSTFQFYWYGLTIITPTSGTEIRLNRAQHRGYDVWVDFGPKGSSYRAEAIREAFKRGGVEHCEAVIDKEHEEPYELLARAILAETAK